MSLFLKVLEARGENIKLRETLEIQQKQIVILKEMVKVLDDKLKKRRRVKKVRKCRRR